MVYSALAFCMFSDINTVLWAHYLLAACLYNVIVDNINHSNPEMFVAWPITMLVVSKANLQPASYQPGLYNILHCSAFSRLLMTSLITWMFRWREWCSILEALYLTIRISHHMHPWQLSSSTTWKILQATSSHSGRANKYTDTLVVDGERGCTCIQLWMARWNRTTHWYS